VPSDVAASAGSPFGTFYQSLSTITDQRDALLNILRVAFLATTLLHFVLRRSSSAGGHTASNLWRQCPAPQSAVGYPRLSADLWQRVRE
jgi:hypothetical protein